MKKKLFTIMSALVLVTFLVTGCGTKGTDSGTGSEGAAKDTLTFAVNTDFQSFNMLETTAGIDLWFDGQIIGETLLQLNNDFVYEPRLVESFDVSEDGVVYTFHVRPGVVFHNGDTLDAADVAYSLEKAKTGQVSSELGDYIVNIETLDEMTVVVTLNSPQNAFLYMLYAYVEIFPDGIFETDYDFNSNPIGTGPYKFVSFVPGDKLVLVANEDYYVPGEPKIPNLVVKIITDSSTQVVALQNGELDFILPQATDAPLLKEDANITLTNYPTLNTQIAWFNNSIEPFNKTDVRLALNHAIDRDSLAKVIGSDGWEPAKSYTAPCVYGHSDAPGYAYDVEKAKTLLAGAGYAEGDISFTITTRESGKKVAEFLQESFRQVGVTTDIQVVDSSTFGAGLVEGTLDFGVSQIGCGLLAGMNTMLFKSGSYLNTMHYSNTEVDRLFDLAAASLDDQERLDAYAQIDLLLEADAPILPLLWEKTIIASANGLVFDDALFYAAGDRTTLPLSKVYFA